MEVAYIEYALSIVAWAIVGILIVFLGRVAYFYEKTSRQRVGYYLLLVPALLLMGGAVWYIFSDVGFTGQETGDALLFSGGLLLFMFGMRLQELMTGERR